MLRIIPGNMRDKTVFRFCPNCLLSIKLKRHFVRDINANWLTFWPPKKSLHHTSHSIMGELIVSTDNFQQMWKPFKKFHAPDPFFASLLSVQYRLILCLIRMRIFQGFRWTIIQTYRLSLLVLLVAKATVVNMHV